MYKNRLPHNIEIINNIINEMRDILNNNDNIDNLDKKDNIDVPSGNNFFIYVDRQKIPVSEIIYKEFCKGERKELYFKESDAHNQVCYYDALDNDDYNGEDLFADTSSSVEQNVIDNLIYERLYECIKQLNQSERMLIQRLYYYGQSLRQIAKNDNVPVTTLQYRHKKILEKLKNLMDE